VYAYPENNISRFFARHLRLAQRYFDGKTDEITGLTKRICRHICQAGD
jgi:hypothetical protein